MRKTTKDEQLENVLVALAMLEEIPNNKIVRELACWANEEMQSHGPNHCGSAACFGGWVALTPYFRNKYGIRAARETMDTYRGAPRTKREINTDKIAERLFGVDDAFNSNETVYNSTPRSDRYVIKQRLKRAFNELTK